MAGDIVQSMLEANPTMLNKLKLKMLLAREKANKSNLLSSNRAARGVKKFKKGGKVTKFKGHF
ncbi:MAG: hypothetical protein CBC24_08305 [Candidatus Pelagibacter sp. TMED64]|jgi:hypothetical protein|nr:MAG: hypothetical protein CBC24_08305 [Candidatus Pelagibacter sp. TMED64]|tara:strand:+ start:200 stop:388 length:189 start_codon:yes stop_codon:yes gene_type:complete